MNKLISYGIITTPGNKGKVVAARVGDDIVDLAALFDYGVLKSGYLLEYFRADSLNKFMQLSLNERRDIKNKVLAFLAEHAQTNQSKIVFSIDDICAYLPVQIGGYTDFYASKQHATNIGKIFRPDNPLLPNWQHLPIAYNGRASSVMESGYPVKRPHGQILVDGAPVYAASRKLDFEVELGIVIGKNSVLGEPISTANAHEYIFGICLVNDWSARDIQAWEYQPLGPFTSKSFLTSISSFIIPLEELDEFKSAAVKQDPKPQSYLVDNNPYTYDIKLEVTLSTSRGENVTTIGRTNFKDIYWTMAQWIAQHTVTGCNLRVGDLLASGTISGDAKDSYGSLMELTVNGSAPLTLSNGETRTFLEDGDSLVITGYCETKTGDKINLGSVAGTVHK